MDRSKNGVMKGVYPLVVFLLVSASGGAQQRQRWPLRAAVFSNATLLPPVVLTRIFAEPLHPGLSLGTTYTYRNNGRHELLQTFRAGYFYHRYNQHAIQLYTEAGYRLHSRSGLDAGLLIGGGYLHAIPTTPTFAWNGRGSYDRKRSLGRPRAMISSALELGYSPRMPTGAPVRFFLAYQFWLQTPFLKQYVPLLPNTALHLGASVPLRKPVPRNGTH
ncbi:MAG: hypothetical protein AVDCRST_MAG56-6690 [uncultured Cytophagales bacterium]|uniref:Outer membrane protein beta-barrel domain-containing protein n=1 Tax=uncultured Cytophagales bacterium TaxID=158755 RepID=A0A6J4KWP2_9SPHI|nr:MAG: hypothetical protein AVDCRST_MAG56-6690 [uncultured Cytophagales bacterium]